MLYGYLIFTNDTLRVNDLYINVFARGFAGLMLGAAAMELSSRVRTMNMNSVRIAALTAVELLCLAGFLFLITRESLSKTPLDAVAVMLMFVSFTISLSGVTLTSRIKSKHLGGWFAIMSLAVYCLHWGVFRVLELTDYAHGDTAVLVGYATTIALSALVVFLVDRIKAIKGRRSMQGA